MADFYVHLFDSGIGRDVGYMKMLSRYHISGVDAIRKPSHVSNRFCLLCNQILTAHFARLRLFCNAAVVGSKS